MVMTLSRHGETMVSNRALSTNNGDVGELAGEILVRGSNPSSKPDRNGDGTLVTTSPAPTIRKLGERRGTGIIAANDLISPDADSLGGCRCAGNLALS